MSLRNLRNRVERAIYSAYRARVRRSSGAQRPELPADVPEDLALPVEAQSRTVSPLRRAAVMPVSILASSLLLTLGGGLYLGYEAADLTGEPATAQVDTQTSAATPSNWRAENDVCLARLQAREDGDAGIFDAAQDADYQRCTAEREADVAQLNTDAQ